MRRLPNGVELSALADRVFERLEKYTAFPWPVMHSQCRRCDLDPAALDPSGLRTLMPHLVQSVARFTSASKGEALRAELEALCGAGPRRAATGTDGDA